MSTLDLPLNDLAQTCRICSVLGPPSTNIWPLLEAHPQWERARQAMPEVMSSSRAARPPRVAVADVLRQHRCLPMALCSC